MYCPTNHYTKDDFIYESILNKWKYLKDDRENDNKEHSNANRRNSDTGMSITKYYKGYYSNFSSMKLMLW